MPMVDSGHKFVMDATVDLKTTRLFRRRLLHWYSGNRREFPWRRSQDPYVILLSEVLLQRTQAPQVAAHFDRILDRFPSPCSLADATEEKIAETLKPLGLAKRAATLRSTGKAIVGAFGGAVPDDPFEISRLPGVGRYIAAATACFAFHRRVAIVDANVIRVFFRYFGISSKKKRPRDDESLWEFAQIMLPRKNVEIYNRALIDFASIVCTNHNPKCATCPMISSCFAGPQILQQSSV